MNSALIILLLCAPNDVLDSDHHLYIPYTSLASRVSPPLPHPFHRASMQMWILGDEQLHPKGKGLVLSKQATDD